MSKKAFLAFILFIIAVFGILGWYFLFRTETIPGMEPRQNDSVNPFPFGQGSPQTDQPVPNGTTASSTTIDISLGEEDPLPRLRQISFVPTAGAVAFGDSAAIRYIERATGHIYETQSDSSATSRISNVTIPKVNEAIWANDGSRLLIRYLKDDEETVRTFYAKISSTTRPETALEGLFLPEGLKTISMRGSKVFYLVESETGAQGYTSNLDGSGRTSIFSSQNGELRTLSRFIPDRAAYQRATLSYSNRPQAD